MRRSGLLWVLGFVVGCEEVRTVDPHLSGTADSGGVLAPPVDFGTSDGGPADMGPAPPFRVRPGVEIVTVTEARPEAPLTLYNAAGERLITLIADLQGQAHFAYVPGEHGVFQSGFEGDLPPVQRGTTVEPGDGYTIRDDSQDPPDTSAPFKVLGVHEAPDPSFYDQHPPLNGIIAPLIANVGDQDVNDGFNYITMRDGVQLGVMVRFPIPRCTAAGPGPRSSSIRATPPRGPTAPSRAPPSLRAWGMPRWR